MGERGQYGNACNVVHSTSSQLSLIRPILLFQRTAMRRNQARRRNLIFTRHRSKQFRLLRQTSSVRPSHSRTLLKPLDVMRCHLAGTLVWSQVILCKTWVHVPHGKRSDAAYHQITLALVSLTFLIEPDKTHVPITYSIFHKTEGRCIQFHCQSNF